VFFSLIVPRLSTIILLLESSFKLIFFVKNIFDLKFKLKNVFQLLWRQNLQRHEHIFRQIIVVKNSDLKFKDLFTLVRFNVIEKSGFIFHAESWKAWFQFRI